MASIENNIWTPDIFTTHTDQLRYGGATRLFEVEKNEQEVLVKFINFLSADQRDIKILIPDQKHTTSIGIIKKDFFEKNLEEQKKYIQDTDGLITDLRHVALVVSAADCAPVAVYDPEHRVFGLFHSGWRGTAGEISKKGIEYFVKEYGSDPKKLLVSIGPTISSKTYEVDTPVYEEFKKKFSDSEMKEIFIGVASTQDKYFLDIQRAITISLLASGISEKNIQISDYDTSKHSDHFPSARKAGGVQNIRRTLYAGILM